MAGHDFGVDHRGVQLAVLLGLPRGRVLHLSRDSVWWWEKLEGIHNNISNDKHVYLQFGHLELKSPGKEKKSGRQHVSPLFANHSSGILPRPYSIISLVCFGTSQ